MLKSYPQIIDDFLVGLGCNPSVVPRVHRFGDRISGHEVSQLRKLYEIVFDRNDSYISSTFGGDADPSGAHSLIRRWGMPNINYKTESESLSHDLLEPQEVEGDSTTGPRQTKSESVASSNHHRKKPQTTVVELEADQFLGSADRLVILGDPGFGKCDA